MDILHWFFWAVLSAVMMPYIKGDLCQRNYYQRDSMSGEVDVTITGVADDSKCYLTFYNTEGFTFEIDIHLLKGWPSDQNCDTYLGFAEVPVSWPGFPRPLSKHCSKPERPFITTLQAVTLMLKVETNVTINLIASYTFHQERSYSHLRHNQSCGEQLLTAPISSLTLDLLSQNSECNWIIEAPPGSRILVKLTDLQADNTEYCLNGNMMDIYDGITDTTTRAIRRFCGDVKYHADIYRQVISTGRHVGIRVVSPENQMMEFSLDWNFITDISASEEIPCGDVKHYCEGGQYCADRQKLYCTKIESFCIDRELICDSKPSCGFFDDSDEYRCDYRKNLLMIILPSIVALLIIAFIGAWCIRRKVLEKHRSRELAREKLLNRRRRRAWVPGSAMEPRGQFSPDHQSDNFVKKSQRKISLPAALYQSARRKSSATSAQGKTKNYSMSLATKYMVEEIGEAIDIHAALLHSKSERCNY